MITEYYKEFILRNVIAELDGIKSTPVITGYNDELVFSEFEGPADRYICNCNQTFTDQDSLIDHISTDHPNPNKGPIKKYKIIFKIKRNYFLYLENTYSGFFCSLWNNFKRIDPLLVANEMAKKYSYRNYQEEMNLDLEICYIGDFKRYELHKLARNAIKLFILLGICTKKPIIHYPIEVFKKEIKGFHKNDIEDLNESKMDSITYEIIEIEMKGSDLKLAKKTKRTKK
jgi:hypothetical protein